MKINFDGMDLACSRITELSVDLSTADSLTINAGGEEIFVKYVDGKWRVFCNQNVELVEGPVSSGFSI